MQRLFVTAMTVATIFLFGTIASKADVATNAATAIPKVAKNFSPIHPAACRGFGPRCGPGTTWQCNGYGQCWCAPCW